MYAWRSVYWSEQVSYRTRILLMMDWIVRCVLYLSTVLGLCSPTLDSVSSQVDCAEGTCQNSNVDDTFDLQWNLFSSVLVRTFLLVNLRVV